MFLPQGSSQNFKLIYYMKSKNNWSEYSHVPCQLLLQVVELLALSLHGHPGHLSSPQVVPHCLGSLHHFASSQGCLLNLVLVLDEPLLSLDFSLKILNLLLPLLSIGLICFFLAASSFSLSLKSKISYPKPESMSNAYILNEHHIHNTENPKAMHTLIIFHSNIILLMHWFVFPNNHNL